ncbi:MAG: PAS domain S-box protein, partial [Calditrichaeota bacterium]
MPKTENSMVLRDYQTTITILEHLRDAVFILTPNGQIRYANRAAGDLLDLALQDLLGKNLNNFLEPPVRFEDNEQNFLEQICQNGLQELESNLKNGDHQTPVSISFGFVRNKADRVDYIIATARDLSTHKAMEKELQQQQLLLQSRDHLRELGDLAINIVHRMSQPLTSIQLLADMMQKQLRAKDFNAQSLEHQLEQLTGVLNELSSVISNVRNFAFLVEEENFKPVSIAESVQSAHDQLNYELTEQDVRVVSTDQGAIPQVLANPLSLQQTFATLFRFFLKIFTAQPAEGGRQIAVDCRNVDDHWVEVTVTNLPVGGTAHM